MTADPRIVYGARCSWWDSIDKVGETAPRPGRISGNPFSLPACPFCLGVLFEVENEASWWAQVDEMEANGMPDYHAFIEWLRGKCRPSLTAARAEFDSEHPTERTP